MKHSVIHTNRGYKSGKKLFVTDIGTDIGTTEMMLIHKKEKGREKKGQRAKAQKKKTMLLAIRRENCVPSATQEQHSLEPFRRKTGLCECVRGLSLV